MVTDNTQPLSGLFGAYLQVGDLHRSPRPVWAGVEVQDLVAVHNKPCPVRKVDEDGAVGTGSVGDAKADVCAGARRVTVGLSFEVKE